MIQSKIAKASRSLSKEVNALSFGEPTSYIYNPLDYAWAIHQQYLELRRRGNEKGGFLGMNPGPFGMAQTGVPFGEIPAVRDWMGLYGEVDKPMPEHPKRPVDGLNCTKSEVSGRRLWGLFAEKFPDAKDFFGIILWLIIVRLYSWKRVEEIEHPINYLHPKKPLEEACDQHLREIVGILQPEWLIGVGGFARKRAEEALEGIDIKIGTILHPSPASPAANRGWAEAASKQLKEQGIWK